MKKVESIVIVGGGLAAANAAFELRERGYAGRIRLISDEASLPYERPPLSKGYLRGEEPIDKALVRPAGDYASQNVEVVRGHVTRLHLSERKVELADGKLIGYRRLLIATGAEPRRLDIPGSELPGIHYLRNVEDSDAIRDAAARTGEAVVIGGGWIGTEVAASLRQLGHEVTLIAPPPRPLEQFLGPDVAQAYRLLHEEHGVRVVDGFVASLEGSGAVEQVTLQDGTRVPARLVVAGIGAIARIELAQEWGLRLRDTGIEVDERLETSIPGVFAAGDVATAWHPRFGRQVRVEHWDNAI